MSKTQVMCLNTLHQWFIRWLLQALHRSLIRNLILICNDVNEGYSSETWFWFTSKYSKTVSMLSQHQSPVSPVLQLEYAIQRHAVWWKCYDISLYKMPTPTWCSNFECRSKGVHIEHFDYLQRCRWHCFTIDNPGSITKCQQSPIASHGIRTVKFFFFL